MSRLRNALYGLALEAERYAKEYRTQYSEPIGRDGTVGTALLDILRALLVLALLDPDDKHYTQMVRDIAAAAGYGKPNSVGAL